ncbi:hypothetical protein D3C81_1447920 [compost metagenome]
MFGIDPQQLPAIAVTRLPQRAGPKATPGVDAAIVETAVLGARRVLGQALAQLPMGIEQVDATAQRDNEAALLAQAETAEFLGQLQCAHAAIARIKAMQPPGQDIGPVQDLFTDRPDRALAQHRRLPDHTLQRFIHAGFSRLPLAGSKRNSRSIDAPGASQTRPCAVGSGKLMALFRWLTGSTAMKSAGAGGVNTTRCPSPGPACRRRPT